MSQLTLLQSTHLERKSMTSRTFRACSELTWECSHLCTGCSMCGWLPRSRQRSFTEEWKIFYSSASAWRCSNKRTNWLPIPGLRSDYSSRNLSGTCHLPANNQISFSFLLCSWCLNDGPRKCWQKQWDQLSKKRAFFYFPLPLTGMNTSRAIFGRI